MKDKFASIEELLSDPGFRNWVLHPDPISNRYWRSILVEKPEYKDRVLQARLIILDLKDDSNAFTSDDESVLWERIQTSVRDLSENENKIININRNKPVDHALGYASNRNSASGYWIHVAAIFIGLLIAVTVAIQEYAGSASPEEPITYQIEKAVPKGQKLKMHLPDGSNVALNASSKITYLKDFSDTKRIVEIEGEVFFDIKKDTAHPFIVKCQGLETEVLGTSFNINAYETTGNIVVSLLEGKVKVNTIGNDELILLPGEEVILEKSTGNLKKKKIDHFSKLKWMDGTLAFNNEPIKDVFEKLEQWYGVDFVVDEFPRDKVLTGKFENEYLDNVLQSITYTVNFDFAINGDTVHVSFK